MQRTEVRRQRVEDRGLRSEDRGQRSEARLSSSFRPLSSAFRPPPSVLRPLSSVLRPLSSVLRPPSSVLCSGQAAIELAIGLLLLMLLLTGLIHVNRMARTSLFLQAVLRGDAGEQAMAEGALSVTPAAISDWQEGADGLRYTADDQPIIHGANQSATLSAFVGYSVKSPSDWSYVASDTRLPASMIQLSASPSMAATLGFVHTEETLRMPVDPVIRQLVYGKDDVAIREDVWMPIMGGLY